MGKKRPITPVLDGSTSPTLAPIELATCRHMAWASATPRLPVATFEQ